MFEALKAKGVTVHCDDAAHRLAKDAGINVMAVTDHDWAEEYYSLDLAVGVVDDLEAAIGHIALEQRPHRGHRHRFPARGRPVLRSGGLSGRHGQRQHPLYRR